MKLHRCDASAGRYLEVTDTTAFGDLVGELHLEPSDWNGTEPNGGQRMDQGISAIFGVASFRYPWLYVGKESSTEPVLDWQQISYSVSGRGYFFEYR